MAHAALLTSGTVQSLCPATSAVRKWHPKRSVCPGSAMTRSSSQANMDKVSLKSSLPLSPLDSLLGRRRRSGLGSNRRGCSSRHVYTAAVEGSIAVEEPSATPVEVSEASEEKTEESALLVAVTPAPVKAERFKPRVPGQKARREDPSVPAEALVEGAVFTGTVTTIQPFGAFVNFGAFTDGLVHISKLSTGYVSNVSDFVTLGQEVKVTILNVEQSSGRIALSMVDKEAKEAKEAATRTGEAREGGDRSRFQQGPDGRPVNRGRIAGGGRQTKRDEPQKPPTKLVKGQEVEGTVKNKIRSGMFVELPEDEEGFLRYSDIPGGENMAPEASLQAGEKIKATVLKIDRGKIVLTMKPIVDITSVNRDINQGKDSGATNPFEIAFRAFNLIPNAVPEAPVATEELTTPEANAAIVEEALAAEDEVVVDDPASVEEIVPEATAAVVEESQATDEEVGPEATPAVVEEALAVEHEAVVDAPPSVEEIVSEATAAVVKEEISLEQSVPEEVAPQTTAAEEEVQDPVLEVSAEARAVEEFISEATSAIEEIPAAKEESVLETNAVVADAPIVQEEVGEEISSPISAVVEEEISAQISAVVEEEISSQVEDVVAASVAVAEEALAAVESVLESTTVFDETPVAEGVGPDVASAELLEKVLEIATIANEVIPEATPAPPIEEAPVKTGPVGISAALVKQLRDDTGAGMMDCKRALTDAGGDIDKARETLRKKGLASAEKKASRIASEGLIGSYIHDSRIGVLVEVNCETDFVSRGPAFKSLVEDVGMQVVASQQVQFVSVDDIPAEFVDKEKELEAEREDLVSKPEAIRSRIVEGRVSKRLNEIVLLEQPYIRDDKILLKDLVKQTVATLGENIKVRRFERYVLGEGLQKKDGDFAAEVAAQTAVKEPVESPKVEENPVTAPDTTSQVIVSAALVKELRDQTGAGMMDCKRALASTENDVEKAVEFLRKKGLASADKKASRLASEGLIGSYVHDGRIGILIEVNCETDFVARGEKFKELVEDLAMQVAAYPQVQVVSVDDVPAEVVAKEKEMEAEKEDLASKPEAIRSRIVDGRVTKRLSELALLEQAFIKNDKKLVKDIVKETVASLGENIQVRRFTRFNLGEGIQKKVVDFASEVAAQTGKA